jgi:c-di-GMP-related signal transduction protein
MRPSAALLKPCRYATPLQAQNLQKPRMCGSGILTEFCRLERRSKPADLLSYLQQMPFDVIKIDKSFVDRIGAGDPSDNICRIIISMAHELGKKSIAEGVETREQLDFLKNNACDFVQGFYYSQPLTKEDFVAFIEKQDFHTQRRKALEIVKI